MAAPRPLGVRAAGLACLFALLSGMCSGCATVAGAGRIWAQPPAEVVLPEIEPVPEDAPEGRPASFDDGVLWCSSVEEAEYLLRVEERDAVCRDALDLAYRGRRLDREEAEGIVAARELQLAEARRNQPRLFAAGVGVGIAGTVGLALAIVLAQD